MSTKVVLNRLLTLEDPTRLPDGAGGFIQDWVPLGRMWAEVKPRLARERQDASTVQYRILIRSVPAEAASRPRPDQRFRDGSRLYHIEAVTEATELGRYLICYAYEETGA